MMYHFAVYRPDTGEVVRAGRSSNARAVSLAREGLAEGQALFEGEIDPTTQILPSGVLTPRPDTKVVRVKDVRDHADRLLSYTDWVIIRELDTGKPADPEIKAQRQAIRNASNVLEAMDPIPTDFKDARYWPT
jgi:hypothetical protein